MCNRGATKDLISRYRSAMIVHCIRAFCDHDPTLEQGYALNEEIPAAMTDNGESKTSAWTLDFRPDLAFPKLTEEMVERLGSYGREEMLPANVRQSVRNLLTST